MSKDKFGNRWPLRVLENWIALAIEALRVRHAADDEGASVRYE